MSKATARGLWRMHKVLQLYLPGPNFNNFFNVFYYPFKFTLEIISLMLTIWSALLPSS